MENMIDEVLDKVVSALENMEDTLSGDDSALENVWDEIKDQVQHGMSPYWGMYLRTMQDLIGAIVAELNLTDEIELLPGLDEEPSEGIEAFLLQQLLLRAEEPLECEPFHFTYFCYPLLDFTAYGKVLSRTGTGVCEAQVFSAAAPAGEIGEVNVGIIDSLLSEEEFLLAEKQSWPEKWVRG